MKHSVPHDLNEALARKTVEMALASYRQKYPHATVDLAWKDESTAKLKIGVKGIDIKGELHIAARAIQMDVDVPLLMRPFTQKAIAVIDREVMAWVAKAKVGEFS